MKINCNISINRSPKDVWHAISDIENAKNMISGIANLTVLNKPETGLVGLKWKETRVMFGKEADETMWITDARENDFYTTRAESHGMIYTTRFNLKEEKQGTALEMTFEGESQSAIMKLLAAPMGLLMKNPMKKALNKDLEDIKAFCESKQT